MADTGAISTLALRERFRDRYQREQDPVADERRRWRAHTFRHLVHLLPGQTVLELGCGGGEFAGRLHEISRGENPITAVTFETGRTRPPELAAPVEFLAADALPGALAGRQFDHVLALDLLDRRHCAWVLERVHDLLRPGGQFVFYESNPWNPVLRICRAVARRFGREDPRRLLSRRELYELISDIGFVRVFAIFNDFLYRPLSRGMIWRLRNASVLLENCPAIRCLAGSILVHAQKPPRQAPVPHVSLARHAELRDGVSVVIPCYREEANVEPLITRLLGLFGDYVHEILPVHDEGGDGTRAVLERLAAADARIRPIFRTPPAGVGRAIAEGFRAATGRYVLAIDCDFQHVLPEVRDIFDAAIRGCDVVVGSRFSRDSVLLNYPFLKIVANRGFHLIARLLLRRRFHDLTNNLKLLRREVVGKLTLLEPGFAVNAETGLQPLLMGFRVGEVPISWVGRAPGMGVSSFGLGPAGGGYARVLARAWRFVVTGGGPYRELTRVTAARTTEQAGPARAGMPHERRMTRRRRQWGLALLLVLAFLATRVALLGAQGLWADEFFSLAMATGHSLEHSADAADPAEGDFVEAAGAERAAEVARWLEHEPQPAGPGRVVRAVGLSDTSPPVYYLLLWAWTRMLDTSDAALRAFSLWCALATLPLVALVARRAGGRAAVFPACVLFTLLPASVWYSTEGRMYSLLWLEATGLAALTQGLGRRGAGGWRGIAWVLVGAAGLLTHYAFAFVFAATVMTLALRPGRLPRAHLAWGSLAVALLVLPWYLRLPEATAAWRVTDYWLKLRPEGFNRGAALAALAWSFLSIRGVWGVAREHDLVHGALVAVLLVAATWRLRAHWIAPQRLLPWLWLGAVWLGPVVLDALQGTYLVAVPRYALGGLPAAVVLAGTAFAALPRRPRGCLLVLLAITSLVGVRRIHLDPDRNSQPFRELGQQLAASTGPDDLIIVHSIPSGVAGLARAVVAAGRDAKLLSWVQQLGRRRVPEDVLAAGRGCSRIVHVSIHAVGASPVAEQWLSGHARTVRTLRNRSARITFFAPSQGDRF